MFRIFLLIFSSYCKYDNDLDIAGAANKKKAGISLNEI